jgi:hypothetical protein
MIFTGKPNRHIHVGQLRRTQSGYGPNGPANDDAYYYIILSIEVNEKRVTEHIVTDDDMHDSNVYITTRNLSTGRQAGWYTGYYELMDKVHANVE